LAAVAVTRPSVLLLDEPTRGLDGGAISDLARTLHALAASGAGILIATHDRRLASAAHRVLQLEAGKVDAARSSAQAMQAVAPTVTGY
jgi:energy-coupling factor transporter ATP-binding protein EcfA2